MAWRWPKLRGMRVPGGCARTAAVALHLHVTRIGETFQIDAFDIDVILGAPWLTDIGNALWNFISRDAIPAGQ